MRLVWAVFLALQLMGCPGPDEPPRKPPPGPRSPDAPKVPEPRALAGVEGARRGFGLSYASTARVPQEHPSGIA